jgi:integrase
LLKINYGGKAVTARPRLTEKPRKLTDAFVRKVKPPEQGRQRYPDDDPHAQGFGVAVYAGGAKSFYVDYRLDGSRFLHTIGEFPIWSVVAARERAREIRRLVNQGRNPAGDRRERREAPTIADLVERYVNDHLPKKTAVGPRANDERTMLAEIERRLKSRTKVADIHSGDLLKMHRDITESGRPVRANRILSVASKMFALSLVSMPGENAPWRDAVQGNPCKGIERNHEDGRERYFSQSELTAISDALNKYPGVAADCLRLVMLTGCRPGEAMQATWTEFDTEAGFWIKPSAHTKQRKIHRLPLNPPALELIDKLRKKRKGKWVFPGDRAGEHLAAIWHVWEFIRKETGLGSDARAYDLRHTFASVGVGGGLGLPIIGRLLGHTQARTTQRYAHVADDPAKEATDKIGAVIAGAGQPGAKVVDIKRR